MSFHGEKKKIIIHFYRAFIKANTTNFFGKQESGFKDDIYLLKMQEFK